MNLFLAMNRFAKKSNGPMFGCRRQSESGCLPPEESLEWEHRRDALTKEIKGAAADLVLLQDVVDYADHMQPQLHNDGLTAVLKKKTGRRKEHVMTFYRTDK